MLLPAAKITAEETYSIVTDYLGTPVEMYDSSGEKTWEAEYDIYGKVRNLSVGSLNDCPFRYQGQYEDEETGLYYNRFRYYDSESGIYVSQDPIGLRGRTPTLYAYTKDINVWIDPFGLDTFYQLYNNSGDLVYEGITERNVQDRLIEHASDGKEFLKVRYVDDLPDRA